MVCLHCQQPTQVINSRLQRRTNSIWRRRKCQDCHTVFTTHEIADYTALWRVLSTNQALVPFSRDKLLVSLYKSLQHRPTALADASGLTDTVITNLRPLTADGLLQRQTVIDNCLLVLGRFDTVAATHYQAFHK